MKYMGSKNRIAKKILSIILEERKDGQFYVEPFVGGANMIDKVTGNRIGGEFNHYVASMWIELQKGITPPTITRDDYKDIKDNKENHPDWLVGWAGIACSYSGKWFGGFAGEVKTKGGIRDYQAEAHKNLKKQIENLKGVKFISSSYDDLEIPACSLIYCDPPYEGTTGYKDNFNHVEFWDWCRKMSKEGHKIFISEYNAPEDFVEVWSQEVSSSLSANGKSGKNKKSIEKLFIHNSQLKNGHED